MQTFTVTNSVNQQVLAGFHFDAPKKPKAVMALIHGFGEHSLRYEHFAAAMAENNIAVMSVDLHGHGKTEGKRGVCHSFHIFMTDVDALLDHVKATYPDVPLFLFGHSMGGNLVLNNVLRRRTEGLAGVIASAPLIEPGTPVPNLQRQVLRLIRKTMKNFNADAGLDSSGISTLQTEVDKYNTDPLVHGKMGAGLAVDLTASCEWLTQHADVWYDTLPLMIYHAKDDPLTKFSASEDFASKARGAEFHAFENVLHEMHNDTSRDAVYALLDQFISKHV